MPAPLIQIKLLKIMALLGSGDKSSSEIMYMVLGDLFRKCDSSTNLGNAILYECIRCISCILHNPKLLEAAADAISNFLKPQRSATMKLLPKLLPVDMMEASVINDAAEEPTDKDKEDEESVKQLSDKDLLKRHIERSCSIQSTFT